MGKVTDRYQRQYAGLVSKRHGNHATDVKIVVVTGALGKTTTAQYLYELLEEAGQSVQLLAPGTDAPLTVREVQQFLRRARKQQARYAIVVASESTIGRHAFGTAPLELVIVTNTSDEILPSIRRLLAQKPRYSVINHDDPGYESLADSDVAQVMSFGTSDAAEAKIDKMTLYRKGAEVKIIIDHQTKLKLATYLLGSANLANLTAAVTAMYVMGESIMSVDEGAARLETVAGNLQSLDVATPYQVIVDCAPNDVAVKSAVDSAKQITQRRLLVALQADSVSEETIHSVGEIASRVAVVDVNDSSRNHGTVERVVSPDAAVKLVLRGARQGDTVLLAGSAFARQEEDGKSYAEITTKNTLRPADHEAAD